MKIYRKNRTQHAGLFNVNGVHGMYFVVGDTFDRLYLESIRTGEVIFIFQNKSMHNGNSRIIKHSKDSVIIPGIKLKREWKEDAPNGFVVYKEYENGAIHAIPHISG